MFDELKLSLLELYQLQKSSKLDANEKDKLRIVINDIEIRINQLDKNYEQVKSSIDWRVQSTKTLLEQRVPNYDVE